MRNYSFTTLPYMISMAVILLSACGSGANIPTEIPPVTDTPLAVTHTGAPTIVVPTFTPTISPADGEVSFSNAVLPILKANCTRCHGTSRQSAGLKLNTYENVIFGSENGLVIVPGDSASSLLVEIISSGEMPKRADKLTEAEIQTISEWVNAGAPNN